MAATKQDIRAWASPDSMFHPGEGNATHMIIVCDTFDWDDYPIYANGLDEFRVLYEGHNGTNMQKVMEVYDLNGDIEAQLNEHRAFHFPEGW